MDWERALLISSKKYYTDLIMLVICFILIVITVKLWRKEKIKILLFIYTTASFIQIIASYLLILTHITKSKLVFLDVTTSSIFMVIELSICYLLLLQHISSSFFKATMKVFYFLFIIGMTGYLISEGISYQTNDRLFTIENMLILIPCLYYFYELFTQPPNKNLIKEPFFWIASGMLMFFSTTTPIFLTSTYLHKNYPDLEISLYSVVYMAYSILFITFIIAITCNPGKQILQS
jgi:hypothetical protein